MLAAVAREDRISRMRVNRALRGSYHTGNVRESSLHFAFELARLDALRVTGNLGGVSALSATAKYQGIASRASLSTAFAPTARLRGRRD
jgi:hypothetical protein